MHPSPLSSGSLPPVPAVIENADILAFNLDSIFYSKPPQGYRTSGIRWVGSKGRAPPSPEVLEAQRKEQEAKEKERIEREEEERIMSSHGEPTEEEFKILARGMAREAMERARDGEPDLTRNYQMEEEERALKHAIATRWKDTPNDPMYVYREGETYSNVWQRIMKERNEGKWKDPKVGR